MADKKTKKVGYSEPSNYFPKEIRDSFTKGDSKKKKTVSKKKVK